MVRHFVTVAQPFACTGVIIFPLPLFVSLMAAKHLTPRRIGLLDDMEMAVAQLSALIGDWEELASHLRLELIRIRQPMLDDLLTAGRLP